MQFLREKLFVHKTPVLYTSSSVVKALVSLVVGFIIAKYVSPEDLGLWTTISLALTYSVFLQAGIINGLNLELPYAYGKGEIEKAEKMAGVAQTYTLVISIFVFVFGIFCFFFLHFQSDKMKWGILSITIIICFSFYQNYLLSTFRSNNSFLKLSYIQIVDAVVNLITIVLIVHYFYYGMLIKAVAVICIYVFLLHLNRPIKVKLYWNKDVLLKLSKVGLPIFGLAYMESIASTFDKIWLINFSDLTQVGLYSFGLYALTAITLFSNSVASYIYPRMTYNYGKSNDRLVLWSYVKKITIILFLCQIPIAIIGYILMPYLIQTYFPKYILSISTMQILLIAGILKGMVIGVNVLWSIKKWKYMIIYQVSYSVLLISFTFLFFRIYENRIEGIAYGVLYANLFNFFNGLFLSYRATH